MRPSTLIAVSLLSGCWRGQAPVTTTSVRAAPDTVPAEEPAPSYRAVTIAVDAFGVAAMTVGLIGLSRGGHDDFSGGLLALGGTAAVFGAPIVHLGNGEWGRAGKSYLLRSVSTSVGVMIGMGAGCQDNRNELFCGFDGMVWGMAGGLALGGVLDALFLHGTERPGAFVPTFSAGDGNARVGIVGAF